MAIQYQISAIPNCTALTLSLWFQIKSTYKPFVGSSFRANLFGFGADCDFGASIAKTSYIFVAGVVGGDAGSFDIGLYATFCGRVVTDEFADQFLMFAKSGSTISAITAPSQHVVTFDQWHHVMVAINMADQTSHDAGAFFTCPLKLYLDKTNVGYDTNPSDVALDVGQSYLRGDRDIAGIIAVEGGAMAVPQRPDIFVDPDNVVPTQVPVVLAECQGWFGQYIDPSTPDNLAKFVGADGKPVTAETAEAAFGQPDIRFRRNKTKKYTFQTNQGTAGPFAIIGTSPSDYTPGPF